MTGKASASGEGGVDPSGQPDRFIDVFFFEYFPKGAKKKLGKTAILRSKNGLKMAKKYVNILFLP